jgi:hypothetical protein
VLSSFGSPGTAEQIVICLILTIFFGRVEAAAMPYFDLKVRPKPLSRSRLSHSFVSSSFHFLLLLLVVVVVQNDHLDELTYMQIISILIVALVIRTGRVALSYHTSLCRCSMLFYTRASSRLLCPYLGPYLGPYIGPYIGPYLDAH